MPFGPKQTVTARSDGIAMSLDQLNEIAADATRDLPRAGPRHSLAFSLTWLT